MTSLEALVICRDLGFLTLLSFDKQEIKIPSTQDYAPVRCNNPADKLENCEFYSSSHCSNSPNVECLSRENYFYAIAPLRKADYHNKMDIIRADIIKRVVFSF